MPIIKLIASKQCEQTDNAAEEAPAHNPQMLLIGCVDARKDPIADLGIPKGQALILRNIAALVRAHEPGKHVNVEAVLEFAVDVMKVRHIAVMGHTDCGGIRACLDGVEHSAIRRYLAPLDAIRDQVKAEGGDTQELASKLEKEAVRLSITNLRTYAPVIKAEQAGTLTLHGWLLDIKGGRMLKLNEKAGKFDAFSAK